MSCSTWTGPKLLLMPVICSRGDSDTEPRSRPRPARRQGPGSDDDQISYRTVTPGRRGCHHVVTAPPFTARAGRGSGHAVLGAGGLRGVRGADLARLDEAVGDDVLDLLGLDGDRGQQDRRDVAVALGVLGRLAAGVDGLALDDGDGRVRRALGLL